MANTEGTIADLIQDMLDDLTRAERQLALSVLEDYPASGLGPMSALAKDAGVSVPTVARMVQKLGYKGYPEFQAGLREELKATVKTPIAKHDSWSETAPSGHILNRFTDAVLENTRHTLGQIAPATFDHACSHDGCTNFLHRVSIGVITDARKTLVLRYVDTSRLAKLFGIDSDIQIVIDNLESHPNLEAEFAHFLLCVLISICKKCAKLRSCAE